MPWLLRGTSTRGNISEGRCAGVSLLRRGVRVVNIYKGHTLALGMRDHFNARFYLFNNRYTVFITKILFIVFIYSLIYRCRLESQMPIHMQVLKWNWKRTVMYKTIITVSSKYTFFYLAPLILLLLFFNNILLKHHSCWCFCMSFVLHSTDPTPLGRSFFLSFSFVPSFSPLVRLAALRSATSPLCPSLFSPSVTVSFLQFTPSE